MGRQCSDSGGNPLSNPRKFFGSLFVTSVAHKSSRGLVSLVFVRLAPMGPEQISPGATPWELRNSPQSSPERAAQFLANDLIHLVHSGPDAVSDSMNVQFGVGIVEYSHVAPLQGLRNSSRQISQGVALG
jgi:hypothetical protein